MKTKSNMTDNREIKKLYACSHCGLSVNNRGDWCNLGCGDDYNQMIEVKIPTDNPFDKNVVSDLIKYLKSQ